MRKALVLVMRRDPESVTGKERDAISAWLTNPSVTYERIDPSDYLEHDSICRTRKPVMVLLPKERPVPSLAMEHGFAHCVVNPDGTVMRLLPITPQFAPFTLDATEGEQPVDAADVEMTHFNSELIGYVKILDDGVPCFNFKEHVGGKAEAMVEVRVSIDDARIVPILVKIEEFDKDNCIAGLLSDIFLAGMHYQKNRKQ